MGGSTQVSGLLAAILSGAGALFLTITSRNTGAAEEWRARVSAKLQSVYDARLNGAVGVSSSANMARFDERGRVEADVHYNCSSGAPTAALAAAGRSNSQFADEGTALLEEVHAVAPNAGLAFCESQTFVQYTACLQQFVNAGASVMV